MIENCIGVFGLPVGLGLNLRINGVDRVVPMVVEEPSVVAAVSNMARIVRDAGGFTGDADPPIMIGQVQVLDAPDPEAAVAALLDHRAHILARANAVHPNMAARGAGARDIEVRRFDAPWPMLVLHLLIDCARCDGGERHQRHGRGRRPAGRVPDRGTGLPAYSEQPGRPPLRPGDVPCARLIARHGRTRRPRGRDGHRDRLEVRRCVPLPCRDPQ
jgi:hypothetical protein